MDPIPLQQTEETPPTVGINTTPWKCLALKTQRKWNNRPTHRCLDIQERPQRLPLQRFNLHSQLLRLNPLPNVELTSAHAIQRQCTGTVKVSHSFHHKNKHRKKKDKAKNIPTACPQISANTQTSSNVSDCAKIHCRLLAVNEYPRTMAAKEIKAKTSESTKQNVP